MEITLVYYAMEITLVYYTMEIILAYYTMGVTLAYYAIEIILFSKCIALTSLVMMSRFCLITVILKGEFS